MADEAVERVMGLAHELAGAWRDYVAATTAGDGAETAAQRHRVDGAESALRAEVERLAAVEAAVRAYKAARDRLDETDYEVGAERWEVDERWAGDYQRIVDAESALSAALTRREGNR